MSLINELGRNKTTRQTYTPGRKLFVGLILMSAFFLMYNYFDGTDGLVKLESKMEHGAFSFAGKDLASVFGNIFILVIGFFMIYCCVSGAYRIFTFNQFVDEFEGKSGGVVRNISNGQYANVNALISYRNSKMCGMSNDDSADLLIRTSVLDNISSGRFEGGSETRKAASYMESKLNSMTPDKALGYISGKK